jgi:hypothetical protein
MRRRKCKDRQMETDRGYWSRSFSILPTSQTIDRSLCTVERRSSVLNLALVGCFNIRELILKY